MGILRRFNQLLTANMHEFVDGLEDPEVMLRQAVREMEATLGSALDDAARLIAHGNLIRKRIEMEEQRAFACRDRAADAVRRDDEIQSRRWIARQCQHRRIARGMAEELELSDMATSRLRGQIETLRGRVHEARCRLIVLQARHRAATTRRRLLRSLPGTTTAACSSDDFERWAAKIDFLERETDAWVELHHPTLECPSSDTVDGSPEIDSELAALKNSLSRTE